MTAPHQLDIRVYYEDTDFSGFVYHASYLRFMERGRTELLRTLDVAQSALQRDAGGLVFVVARMKIDFLRPGRMDDVLRVETSVVEARGPVLVMRQTVRRGSETLVEADVTIAALRDGRPVRLPPEVKAAFDRARTRNPLA
jgi:acyl-CoA thioester hydrolase